MSYRIFLFLSLLFSAGCKKQLTVTELLAGEHGKSWKRYQYQTGTNTPVLLNDCFQDDVWTFFNKGDLQVDLSGTNCGGFGVTGNILYCTWNINASNDTISWQYSNSSPVNNFRIVTLNQDEFVVHQRVDSAGNTNTANSTIDIYNYFQAR